MRLFWPFLVALLTSVTSMKPPDSDALNDVCSGLRISTTIALKAVTIRDNLSPDPTVETMRLDLIDTLLNIGVKFRVGVKTGEAYSRSGAKVAKDYIYALDQFIVGGLHSEDVPDIARSLIKRVTELLANAKELHTYFGAVQTDLEELGMKTERTRQQIDNTIVALQREIDKERDDRERDTVLGVFCGILGLAFPPALAVAGGLALSAHEHHQNVVDQLNDIKPWLVFSDDVNGVLSVVKQAQSATAGQIYYWSQTLDQLESLKDYSADWLENLSSEWTAKKLLVQWKTVDTKYSQCAYTTSEAHRVLEAHMPPGNLGVGNGGKHIAIEPAALPADSVPV
ncbi:hypothetical protein B0H14DRAFT_2739540 [Mycena olivaceomarginata]|nr:hypothetical protein B0H14DRAFT_2739540 [Mycena olivaceomarginata]